MRKIGVIVLFIPIAIWLLLPMEPTTDGKKVVGIVQQHFEARGRLASPKPYFKVALENGLVIEVQDYGQVTAKKGDAVILQEKFGLITNRRTFNIQGKGIVK